MDQGHKHFSHLHNLVMHQMPEGVEVSCSGCHSSASGTVYVCWQCNFFLHDQCFKATRSLKHPSHPPHPLTLVPYPTYHSNSFYCNSCQIVGTGFSYSCADCEFDLHVQCAYSITRATSFKSAHLFQELVPTGWNGVQNSVPGGQYHSTNHDLPSFSIRVGSQNPLANAQYSSMDHGPSVSIHTSYPPNMVPKGEDPSPPLDRTSYSIPTGMHQNGPFVSIPTNYPPTQDPSQNRPSVSIPASSHNSEVQYPSMAQTGPSVSIPASAQHPSVAKTGSSVNHPPNPVPSAQESSMPQNRPSVSIPTSSHNSSVQYPSVGQTGPCVSVPTNYPPNPIPSVHDPSMPQKRPVSTPVSSHNSSTQYPSMAQTGPSVSIPTNPSDPITSSHDPSMPQNDKENIMHFSHPHKLSRVSLQEDEENEVICSGCEETIVGKGYSCVEPDCNFHLHESCFHLKQLIHHKSHLEHPLTLLPLAPYDDENGGFTCSACFSDGTGFTYHCSICKFDLHIQCVSLPEKLKRADHKHMLKLYYSCPVEDEDYTFYCDVCHGEVQKDRWVYYCESCDYGTHLGCVDCEECERDSILDTQAQLQRLQFHMEMARQRAQLIASMGSSLASLAG